MERLWIASVRGFDSTFCRVQCSDPATVFRAIPFKVRSSLPAHAQMIHISLASANGIGDESSQTVAVMGCRESPHTSQVRVIRVAQKDKIYNGPMRSLSDSLDFLWRLHPAEKP